MKEHFRWPAIQIGQIWNKIKVAAFLALAGADAGLLICTLSGAQSPVIAFLPLIIFVLFMLLYFVLDSVPQIAGKKWVKPVIFTAAIIAVILLLALF